MRSPVVKLLLLYLPLNFECLTKYYGLKFKKLNLLSLPLFPNYQTAFLLFNGGQQEIIYFCQPQEVE